LGIPLSVNRESQEGFTAIPGIGIKLAGAIVRRENAVEGSKPSKKSRASAALERFCMEE
jgi:DNA uptake protein ComE-like DNA-binding protein